MLFRRRLFRERPGQHELGLEHCVEVVDDAVEGRRQEAMDRMLDPALDVGNGASGIALIPSPVERLGDDAELDDEVVGESSGSASPRFSFHSRMSAASSALMMIRASEPPMNWRRLSDFPVNAWISTFSESQSGMSTTGPISQGDEMGHICHFGP